MVEKWKMIEEIIVYLGPVSTKETCEMKPVCLFTIKERRLNKCWINIFRNGRHIVNDAKQEQENWDFKKNRYLKKPATAFIRLFIQFYIKICPNK